MGRQEPVNKSILASGNAQISAGSLILGDHGEISKSSNAQSNSLTGGKQAQVDDALSNLQVQLTTVFDQVTRELNLMKHQLDEYTAKLDSHGRSSSSRQVMSASGLIEAARGVAGVASVAIRLAEQLGGFFRK